MLGVLLYTGSFAQVVHNITANAMTFSPANLTVDIGDTVRWTNTSGSHNVNGTTATYPSNPESFGNAIGMSWTFDYVFSIAGLYDYQCDVHVLSGMTATITVSPPVGFPVESAEESFTVFPIPSSGQVVITGKHFSTLEVLDITGKTVEVFNYRSPSLTLDLSSYKKGIYFVRAGDPDSYREVRKVVLR